MTNSPHSYTRSQLVEAVRNHAIDLYDVTGWDYVNEVMGDVEIDQIIGRARTPQGAISKVAAVIRQAS